MRFVQKYAIFSTNSSVCREIYFTLHRKIKQQILFINLKN
jgi:hypothetical protein